MNDGSILASCALDKQQIPYINAFTRNSVPIVMSDMDNTASGTGFLYNFGSEHFFVTAWHNLSGRDFVTKQPVSPNGWLPTSILSFLPLVGEPNDSGVKSYGYFDFCSRLYFDSQRTEPIWFVDGEQASRIDIAIIPISNFVQGNTIEKLDDRERVEEIVSKLNGSDEYREMSFSDHPVRLLAHSAPSFLNRVEVAQDVFVVGFPEAISGGDRTAIWKRGTVASEPDLFIRDRPCFIIDTSTRPGLSGSPVVARFERPAWDNNGRGLLIKMGVDLGFCGLYSARIGRSADMAQLGVVWTRAAIERIISGRIYGRTAEDYSGLLSEGCGDEVV